MFKVIFLTSLGIATFAFASTEIVKAKSHLVECENTLEIKPTLKQQFDNLVKLDPSMKRARLATLRNTVEQIGSLATGRPIEALTGSSSGIQFIEVQQGITIDDIAPHAIREKMIELLKSIGISPAMWVNRGDEKWSSKGSAGLVKDIVELEYALGGFMDGLLKEDGFQTASVFDKIIRKHQTYLNQSEIMREALDQGFTLVGFDYEGLSAPSGFSHESLIGKEVIVEIEDQETGETIAGYYHEAVNKAAAWDRALEAAKNHVSLPDSQLPALVRGRSLSVAALQNLRNNSHEKISELPQAAGVYRGTIERAFGTGFTIRTGPSSVTTIDTTWFSSKFRGIAVKLE